MKERNVLLKEIGFSDKFLEALSEYEKAIPKTYNENIPDGSIESISTIDSKDLIIIEPPKPNYSAVIII
ncbi:MAG TPA: hypothetical protein PLA68_12540 [Panacibacter sp.]|nr:hypothetical protein [Panacibacter sp.]